MITKVEFKPAEFKGPSDDARNVKRKMTLDITLDRRGICDLIHALTHAIEADGSSVPCFDGTINIHREERDINSRIIDAIAKEGR